MMVTLSRCKITKKKGKTTLKLLDNTLLLYSFLNSNSSLKFEIMAKQLYVASQRVL